MDRGRWHWEAAQYYKRWDWGDRLPTAQKSFCHHMYWSECFYQQANNWREENVQVDQRLI